MDNRIREIFEAIIRTLATVKTDNADGNWNKLLGCMKACQDGLQIIAKEGQQDGET